MQETVQSLSYFMNREYRYLLRWMGAWDKNFFKDFFASLVSKKTVFLGKLSTCPTRKMERTADRNRHFLEKESFSDFPARIEKRCFSLVWEITEKDFVCMDEVDVAKPLAEVMEGLSKVRDGSTGEIVNGYVFHGASVRWIPVILEREDFGKDTKNRVWKRMVDRILAHSKGRWTFLLDAGYDVASYLDFLTERKCRFLIRAKRNRVFFDGRSGAYRKMKEFGEWIHEVRLPKRDYPLFLHVRKNPKFREPMRVLSDKPDPEACKTYFRRWEIEQVFKTMKQEFDLEKVRVLSLKVLENTVAVVQLAVALSNAVFNARNDFRRPSLFTDVRKFEKEYAKFAKRAGLTLNRNSIVTFVSETLKTSFKYKKKPRKERGDPNPPNSSQLRLFTAKSLRKSGEV